MFVLLISLMACGAAGGTPPFETTPTQTPTTPELPQPHGYRRPHPGFPDIEIEEGPAEFAHDRGTVTPVLGYYVGGEKVEEDDVLAAWVRLHGGWGSKGAYDDTSVLDGVRRFMGHGWLTSDSDVDSPVPIADPVTRIVDTPSGRFVVFIGTSQTHVSQRGAHYEEVVRVFDARTGTVPASPPEGVPVGRSWSDAEPPR